jgi:uncharacterized membrane protein
MLRTGWKCTKAQKGIPGLQGKVQPRGAKPDLMQETWSPTTRLLAGIGAGILMLYGRGRKGVIGTALSLTGIGTAFRVATNMPITKIVGMSDKSRVIDINKSIEVDVPIEQAYELWSNFENFPKFMTHVQEVKDLGNGRSHWIVTGPVGIPVEFDARVTENTPNEVIAWETEPDSMVKHRGHVKFRPGPELQTLIHVHLKYNPPAGVFGHTVASIFGTDPKQAMDEDLVRLKSLLEVGKTTADGDEVTKDQL